MSNQRLLLLSTTAISALIVQERCDNYLRQYKSRLSAWQGRGSTAPTAFDADRPFDDVHVEYEPEAGETQDTKDNPGG